MSDKQNVSFSSSRDKAYRKLKDTKEKYPIITLERY